MDEPESIAALTLASRERLDNLTFVINCNLQRLDGPVRGNGQIIQELEALFAGAGWNVIKVLWGSDWDPLFARDHANVLLKQLANTVDGQYQTLGANDGAYNQANFFQLTPELRQLVAHMSVEQIDSLKRGQVTIFASCMRPSVPPGHIRANRRSSSPRPRKALGWAAGESRNTSHQQKKLDLDTLRAFRSRFQLPLSDADLAELKFIATDLERGDALSAGPARGAWWTAAEQVGVRGEARDTAARQLRDLRHSSRGQGNVHDHGNRANAR